MELSHLYFEQGMEKKFDLFLERNEDKILSLLPPSISQELSLFFLTGGEIEHRRLFQDLGLIRGLSLTQRGKRIISAYPLFGSGKEKKGIYSTSFFPFLFSLLSQSLIPRRFERYISSQDYLSLFPWREESDLIETTRVAISSLINLGVITKGPRHLELDVKSSLLFMKKDEIDRLTYIFSSEGNTTEREKIKNFLTLILLFNGIKKEEIEDKLSLVSKITGAYIPLQTLLLWGLLSVNGDYYSAPVIKNDKEENPVVSADMTLSYRGTTSCPLWRFAIPLKADSLNIWAITKKSIKAAFDSGMKKDEIISCLSSFSSSIPPVIVERIEGWEKEYSRIRIERAVVLEADERITLLLKMLPQIQEYIVSNPSDNLFIMDGENEEEWREILYSCGFEMLSATKGPKFEQDDKLSFIPLLSSSPTLPETREIDYSKEERDKILINCKSFIQKSLVESFAVFSSKTNIRLMWVDGLEYRSKRELAAKAIEEDDNLILLYLNGEEVITKPLSLKEKEDGDDLVTENGVFDLSKIWKISQVPGYIKKGQSDSLDSDNL